MLSTFWGYIFALAAHMPLWHSAFRIACFGLSNGGLLQNQTKIDPYLLVWQGKAYIGFNFECDILQL